MTSYYTQKLAGRRLQQCYELASPRVSQYLEAEILHVLSRLRPADSVLELGCGYGRVALRLAEAARRVIGIDTARESLELGRELAGPESRCELLEMNALDLRFADGEFDAVVCVQNGICAFRVDPEELLREALRVTRLGGKLLFSTYADCFWPHRLAWFEEQAAAGLVGPIDYAASGAGAIVCVDGFRSTRLNAEDWRSLCLRLGVVAKLVEIDESALFCEIETSLEHAAP